MFIMSLALADLTVGCIVMPISSAYALTGDWHFGLVICQFWLSVDYTASTASIFNLFILSLDRYWSITSPLRYLRRRTKKRALLMIALAWTGASMWVIPVLGWHYIVRSGQRIVAGDSCETEFATNMTFKAITAILNFYIPTSCMVFLYVRIFLAIRRRARDIDRLGAYTANPSPKKSGGLRPVVSSTQCDPTYEVSTTTLHSPNNAAPPAFISQQQQQQQQQLTPHVRRNQVVNKRRNFNGNLDTKDMNGCAKAASENNHQRKSCEFHRRLTIVGPKRSSKHQHMAKSHQDSSSFTNSNKRVGGGKLPLETLALFEDVRVRVEYVTSPIAQSKRGKYLDSGSKLEEEENGSCSGGEEEDEDNVSLNSLAETHQLNRRGRRRRERRRRALLTSSRATSSSCPNYNPSSTCRKTGNGDESLGLCHEKEKEGCSGRRIRIPPPLSGRQPLTLGHKEAESAAPICELGKKGRKVKKVTSNSHHHHHHHLSEDGGGGHDHHIHCYRSSRVKQPSITVSSPSRSPVPITPPESQDDKVSIGTMTSSQRRKRRELRINNNNGTNRSSNRLERQNTFGQGDRGFIRSFLRRTVSSGDGNSTTGGVGVRRASASMILAQEKKAAKQLGVIVGAFILCWLPYFTLFMAVAYCGIEDSSSEGCVDQTMFTATVWFGYFNSALNPVLYPMCNANFKRAFKQMLGIKAWPSMASTTSKRNNKNNNKGSQYNNHNANIKKRPC